MAYDSAYQTGRDTVTIPRWFYDQLIADAKAFRCLHEALARRPTAADWSLPGIETRQPPPRTEP